MKYEITKTNNGELVVKSFEEIKKEVKKELDTYVVFVPQDKEDYKAVKDARAELNKIKKTINDAKINAINDLTSTIRSQTKEICLMIEEKAKEFDAEAKEYEVKTLNKEVKVKPSFEIVIKVKDLEELNSLKIKLDKIKVAYEVKEK